MIKFTITIVSYQKFITSRKRAIRVHKDSYHAIAKSQPLFIANTNECHQFSGPRMSKCPVGLCEKRGIGIRKSALSSELHKGTRTVKGWLQSLLPAQPEQVVFFRWFPGYVDIQVFRLVAFVHGLLSSLMIAYIKQDYSKSICTPSTFNTSCINIVQLYNILIQKGWIHYNK